MPEYALGIGIGQFEARKELGGHATTSTRIVGTARGARAGVTGFAQRSEEFTRRPHILESAISNIARLEFLMDDKRARVDLTDRVDEADDSPGPAKVQPFEGVT